MKSGNVLLGVLAGVAAGALMGILLAPDKGTKTRKQLLNKGEDFADELKEKYDELVTTLSDKYKSTKSEAEALLAKGKARYSEMKKEKEVVNHTP